MNMTLNLYSSNRRSFIAEEGKMESPIENDLVVLNENKSHDDEDDSPMLSLHALEALKEFFSDQKHHISAEEEPDVVELVTEDWRLSQFWYDRLTAETIASEVLTLSEIQTSPSVACIACPTLYAYFKKLSPEVPAQLLEFDTRFEQYGNEFTFYDYNKPEDLPLSLKHTYSIIVADPPYLSKECLEKIAETITFLTRPGNSFVLLLTGEVQKERAAELLGLRPCVFRPQHTSKLGNEFLVFTNYDPGLRLDGWDKE